jgi:hypothetical protein
MPWLMNIDTPQIGAFINRLEKFDKDVSKELKQEMRKASGRVANESRSLISAMGDPLSNWAGYSWIEQDRTSGRNLQFNMSTVKKGYKVKSHRHRKSGITTAFGQSVVQTSAAGAILELAGSVNKTQQFNKNIINARKSPMGKIPRILGKAYYRVMPIVVVELQAAIRRAEKKVGL